MFFFNAKQQHDDLKVLDEGVSSSVQLVYITRTIYFYSREFTDVSKQ